ncbi:hypothetical protein TNIN_304951 [Trichonephila inaurata madagascariensis]|uniref:Uncharacterized protein n=1 Tax=Trichonephila inaurata madagascariensis TaxID=2747483 RepID=A0A8X6KLY2_9ARAC|nr:hypothetical protein TNIN_304951 [Trichonephila inaurata madagascariensis]
MTAFKIQYSKNDQEKISNPKETKKEMAPSCLVGTGETWVLHDVTRGCFAPHDGNFRHVTSGLQRHPPLHQGPPTRVVTECSSDL